MVIAAPLFAPMFARPTVAQPVHDRHSDDSLMALLPARDQAAQAALEVLYGRYSGAVYGLGLRMLGNAEEAEHLVQETFWRLWRYAYTYEPGRVKLGTWLLRLARNKAISELRAASCRPKAEGHRPVGGTGDDAGASDAIGLEQTDPGGEVPDLVWQAEQRRMIRAALLTLPKEQRQAVELAYFGGLSHREIAATQAAPPSTVKTRLSLGLKKLGQQLGTCGISAGAY